MNENNARYDSRDNCNAIIADGDRLLMGCSTTIIPAGIDVIGESAFLYCENLRSINIPEGVTEIWDAAFWGCSSLRSITIPEGVTEIGDCVFRECFSLQSISLPSSLELLSDTFFDCVSLDSIYIPQGVETIRNGIFRGCTSLRKICVDPRNQTFDSRNGCNAIVRTSTNELIAGCRESVIVDGIEHVGSWAFSGRGITSIHIPASVLEIDSVAFRDNAYCMSISVAPDNPHYRSDGTNSIIERNTNKLVLACATTRIAPEVSSIGSYAYMNAPRTLVLPSGISSIGFSAFSSCKDLYMIFISPTVKHIDRFAFSGLKQLTHVIMMGTPESIAEDAFKGCDNLKLPSIAK